MNKNEFVRAYADKLGVTINEAERYFDTFVMTLTQSLSNGEYVHISGFATFDLKEKNGRYVKTPVLDDPVEIKPCITPVCKFSKQFKEKFNQ